VEYESVAIYFNKSCLPGFELEISGSDIMLSYYAQTSCTEKPGLMGKDEQFTYTSTKANQMYKA
jgi:hypothetical protein